ncbi:MAG: aminodeoxychorismate synthase component I [Trueperaceae bacterium]|nr:aminodeoxychorismate synthase component I [Trueperaceae bacterium]
MGAAAGGAGAAAGTPTRLRLDAVGAGVQPGAIVDAWVDDLRPGDVVLHARSGRAGERRSLRFRDPVATFAIHDADDAPTLLAALDAQLRAGRAVAGTLGYEAGAALVGAPVAGHPGYPLAWFGAYERVEAVDAGPGGAPLRAPRDRRGGVRDVALELDAAAWAARVAAVRAALEAGDAYQVNLTTGIRCRVGDVRDAYRALSGSQSVAFGALLDTGEVALASASPELFVRAQRRGDALRLTTRPMKGTAPRAAEPEADAAAAEALRRDPKNRAENVMIVDLLRNDLGRVARPGSVRPTALFEVERYRRVLQMTSTIEAEADHDLPLSALLSALFPCGSITGAPKRRTMELIGALEGGPRGAYTGAIGYALPTDAGAIAEASFSVAIRTLVVKAGEGRLGVGGGIVVDSEAADEWAEVATKARFLTHPDPPLGLFETLRWEAGAAPRWDAHLARLARSAAHHGIPFDPSASAAAVADAVEAATRAATPGAIATEAAGASTPPVLRVRLDLHEEGRYTAVARPHVDPPADAPPVTVALAARPLRADDPRRRHKTTDRDTYDTAAAWAARHGHADVLFVNEHGRVAEGAISTVFVRDDDGVWRTPPVADGALPGVLRGELLASGAAREGAVTEADLRARELAIGNALRGLRAARLDPAARWAAIEEAPT